MMAVPLEGLESRRLLSVYHPDRAWAQLGVASIEPAVSGDLVNFAFAHEYSDGSVLAIGEEANADVTQPALVRLLSTGSIDTSFGTSGIRRASFDLGINTAEAAPDGSIYAGGLSHDLSTARVAHFLADGTPDAQFGDGGVVTLGIGTQNAVGMADVAALDDGGVLVLAYEVGTDNEEINERLYRLNGDGSFDESFGTDGSVAISSDERTITLQTNGKILLGGGDAFTLLLADGSPDQSFGNDGIIRLHIDRTTSDSLMLSDGRFLATTTYYGMDLNLPAEIRRFNSVGTLDTTFGSNGIATFSTGDSVIFDLKIDADGNIIAYGPSGTDDEGFGPVLARYTADGHPDQTFAENGALRFFELSNASPGRMELEADGSILLTAGGYPGAFLAKVTSAGGQEVFLSDSGTLFVDGTPAHDVIELARSGATVHVNRNGTGSDFSATDVSRIVVDAMAGDDELSLTGGLSSADIHAGSGNDTIEVDGGTDLHVYAGAGDDAITASGASGALNGEEGNNNIQANGGNYVITALAGNDIVTAALNDQGEGYEGSIFVGDGDNIVNCSGTGQFEIVTGTDFSRNDITSGDGDDNISAGKGDDTINGGGGNDAINADAGNDIVRGGDGSDFIFGGEGNDSLYGNAGADSIWGDEGADLISGGGGKDHLAGSVGPDRLYGGRGNDLINGGSGKDRLYGQDDDDRLDGSWGNDTLVGGRGSDLLTDSHDDNFFDSRDGEMDFIRAVSRNFNSAKADDALDELISIDQLIP
jgi:uncharacterized delta-60 repeat protein